MRKKAKTYICIIVFVVLGLYWCACSSSVKQSDIVNSQDNYNSGIPGESNVPKEKDFVDNYAQIIESEHIDLLDALSQLDKMDALSGDAEALYQKLSRLKNCSGRYKYDSEESGNRYIAEVSFYLSKGIIYCSVTYTGYSGTIGDGVISDSQRTGYLYEAFPKGDLYGRELDFTICLSNEQLYISWNGLGDRIIEYTLTRGDGSEGSVQESHQSFEKTGMLDTINDAVEKVFGSYPHNVIYDEDSHSVVISVQLEGILSAFPSNDSELLKRWKPIVDKTASLGETLYNAVKILTYKEKGIWWPYVYELHIYLVDKLNSSGRYLENEILLWVMNGDVKYDIADKKTDSPGTSSTKNSESSENGHVVTSGERNALESANDYLSFMAFSYSGLVEQLEYEGYSNSEAVYAADNCGADWNQQAAKKAKEYLEFTSFSRSDLIAQLEYEGFTHSQAVYGVDKAY